MVSSTISTGTLYHGPVRAFVGKPAPGVVAPIPRVGPAPLSDMGDAATPIAGELIAYATPPYIVPVVDPGVYGVQLRIPSAGRTVDVSVVRGQTTHAEFLFVD